MSASLSEVYDLWRPIDDEHAHAALFNLMSARCTVRPEDISRIKKSGLVEYFAGQAATRLTLVHSTTYENAKRIMAEGYNLACGEDSPGLELSYNFGTVVPTHYPQAHRVNLTTLSYRYCSQPAKVICQFPIPFPAPEQTSHLPEPTYSKYIPAHTPLEHPLDALDAGLVESDGSNLIIPSGFMRGWIDMEAGTFNAKQPWSSY